MLVSTNSAPKACVACKLSLTKPGRASAGRATTGRSTARPTIRVAVEPRVTPTIAPSRVPEIIAPAMPPAAFPRPTRAYIVASRAKFSPPWVMAYWAPAMVTGINARAVSASGSQPSMWRSHCNRGLTASVVPPTISADHRVMRRIVTACPRRCVMDDNTRRRAPTA